MLGETGDGAAARWALIRVGGQVLDPELALEDQGVVEGTMLFLRDITSPTPEPVVDDDSEPVAITVDAPTGRWAKPAAQLLLVGAAALCLLGAGLLTLLIGDRGLRTVVAWEARQSPPRAASAWHSSSASAPWAGSSCLPDCPCGPPPAQALPAKLERIRQGFWRRLWGLSPRGRGSPSLSPATP